MSNPFDDLTAAVAGVPAGAWAVAVSGGADSVALLTLLAHHAPQVRPHVVHLDHEIRDAETSSADARFVAGLSSRLGHPCTVARRRDVEPALPVPRPNNLESLGRACRLTLFRQVVDLHHLTGVLLAHHADDQAETVLMRLARGGGERTWLGMSPETRVAGLTIRRPLLSVRRERLRAWLASIGQAFCEDSSNASDQFARNRARLLLAEHPDWALKLLRLSGAARRRCAWADSVAPKLPEVFAVKELASLPAPLATAAALRWLTKVARCPPQACDADTIARLRAMVEDAASPARQHFPGGVLVRRRAGTIAAVLPGGAPRASHEAQPHGRDTPPPSPAS